MEALTVLEAQHGPDPELISQCVHCGFCLPACSTYVLWKSEMDSPRGRIYLMKMAAEEGMPYFLNLAAVISISIGLLNLFPVPLLDGGHLMFYGIEAVRGKPLSERAQEVGFRIGFAIVVMLMIFATYNDILHLAARKAAS